MTHDVSYYKK